MALLKVIVVNDSKDDALLVLDSLEREGFEPFCTRVETAAELQKALQEGSWQLIVTEHELPGIKAQEVLEVLKKSGRDLPLIIVSDTGGDDVVAWAMTGGAHDYIMKNNLSRLAPFVERELRDAAVREKQRRHRGKLKYLSRNMRRDKQNRGHSANNQVVKAMLAVLSERDYIAGGHADRLQKLCMKMGELVGLDQRRLTTLSLLALIHDLGKVGIPDEILFKAGDLTVEEWEVMCSHPEKGYRIAKAFPDLISVAELILHHHERWDGTGYPSRLKGRDIPIECRVLAIVDAYDAMTSARPYKKAKSKQEALLELKRCAGTQFDPELVDIFLKII